MQQTVYFIGSPQEIEHHAAPLSRWLEHRIVSPDAILRCAQPGDLAVFYCEHFDRFRYAIGELRKRSVATLYMIDGVLEWRNAWENGNHEPACPFTMRPVLSDKVACIGPSQARVLNHWGNQGKVETVGVPRFDRLVFADQPQASHNGFRLLVMTAKCPSYTDQDRANLVRSLRDLKGHLRREHASIEVVWRLTAGLDRELGVKNTLTELTGHELVELLRSVDAVVTSPSTAALEAMLMNRPTAILDYNHTPDYVRSAWKVTAPGQLPSLMYELINPPASKMSFQQQVLQDELYLESSAGERMHQLIDQMLRISRECLDRGQPIEFPDQILDPPAGHERLGVGVSFDHASIYPEFPEFRCDDPVQLQAELAHARREINHLNCQLDQLRAELTEAHQIFAEIHGHPIAGPVVRLRQKLLRMLQKLKNMRTQSEVH